MSISFDKSGWHMVSFGDVVEKIINKVSPSDYHSSIVVEGGHINKRDFHIRKYANKEELGYLGPAFHMGFERHQILYVSRNPHLMKVGYPDFDGICANTTFVLKTKDNEVLRNDLIPFMMHSDTFIEESVSNVRGGVNPYVNWGDLASIQILLPPRNLQDEISELLWSMDGVVEKEAAVVRDAITLQQSILNERCLKSKKSKEFRVSELLVEAPKNGYSPKSDTDGKGSKTVSISSIREGLFIPEGNLKYAVVDDGVLNKFDICKGDIFVVRGNGNKKLCGRAGIATKSYSDMFYPDLLIRLRFDHEKVLPEFSAFLWNTAKTHDGLLRWAKSTNGIWKINGDDIKRHKLSVPSIAEQKDIMKELIIVGESINRAKHLHNSGKKLHQSLINQVF